MLVNFENPERIRKLYPRFSLDTERFSGPHMGEYDGGVPLMYDSANRNIIIDSSDTHTLVYGSTGSLKSRAIVMPTIRILGHAKESMIINDCKGELHTRLAAGLKKLGYHIVVINFRNPLLGNAWNPLFIPYQFYVNGDLDRASEFSNDIANNLMIGDRSTDDPFWDYSASDMLFGLILLLFRYCKEHNAPISSVNIGNLLALRRKLYIEKQQARNSILWKYASEDEVIAASLSGSIYAPNDTMLSILSVFDQKMRTFTIQPTLLDMLANNDFDIGEIGKKKMAIFLITPDEKTSFHKLVSLFIKQSYEYIIYTATLNNDNKVSNRINYILDEFSSLPSIHDMPTMISAARSRDIRFMLVVQSKNSIVKRYKEEAESIISNCTNWIFFTSREAELLKELSVLCGEQKNHSPNISIFDLQHLSKEKREALILCGRLNPAKINMIDIDRLDHNKYAILEFEKNVRQERRKLSFELNEDIKKKYKTESEEIQIAAQAHFLQKNHPFPFPTLGMPQGPNGINVDDMIKRIDEKIAELEAEEAKEKKESSMTTDEDLQQDNSNDK